MYVCRHIFSYYLCTVTNAQGTSPHFSSGMATTATSDMSGWVAMMLSTSMLEIFSPPDIMMSIVPSIMVNSSCHYHMLKNSRRNSYKYSTIVIWKTFGSVFQLDSSIFVHYPQIASVEPSILSMWEDESMYVCICMYMYICMYVCMYKLYQTISTNRLSLWSSLLWQPRCWGSPSSQCSLGS